MKERAIDRIAAVVRRSLMDRGLEAVRPQILEKSQKSEYRQSRASIASDTATATSAGRLALAARDTPLCAPKASGHVRPTNLRASWSQSLLFWTPGAPPLDARMRWISPAILAKATSAGRLALATRDTHNVPHNITLPTTGSKQKRTHGDSPSTVGLRL